MNNDQQLNWYATELPMHPNPWKGIRGDGKPYAPIYYKLEQLTREYLATLDNNHSDESYCTARQLAEPELESFFEWILVNRKLD